MAWVKNDIVKKNIIWMHRKVTAMHQNVATTTNDVSYHLVSCVQFLSLKLSLAPYLTNFARASTDFQYCQETWKIRLFIWLSTEQGSITIPVMFSLITKDQLKRHPRHSPHTLLYYFYLKFIDKFPSLNIYRFVITRLFVFVCLTYPLAPHCPNFTMNPSSNGLSYTFHYFIITHHSTSPC